MIERLIKAVAPRSRRGRAGVPLGRTSARRDQDGGTEFEHGHVNLLILWQTVGAALRFQGT